MSTVSKTYIRVVKLGNTVLLTSKILDYRLSGAHKNPKKSEFSHGGHAVGFCTLKPRTYVNRLKALSLCNSLSTKLEVKSNKKQSSKESDPG